MEVAVIGARIAQFAAAAVLFGTPLFFLYGFKGAAGEALRWPRPLMLASALVLLAGALASLLAQTAMMAGDPAAAFDPEMLAMVVAETAFGRAIVARVALAGLLFAVSLRSGRAIRLAQSGLGAAALATFAWTGHGASEEGAAGAIHATADILHLLAAGVWVGALIALAILLRPRRTAAPPAELQALHDALAGFSGIGSAIVAVILLTGLVNSWFLVGPTRVLEMPGSPYGVLLLVKLGLFLGMLVLAAANRFRLTPALASGLAQGQTGGAIAELRRSVALETAAGLAILGLVGVMGVLAPVSAA